MWLPYPRSDRFQKVTVTNLDVPGSHRVVTDDEFGNRILFVELTPEDSGKPLEIRYHVVRKEKAAYKAPTPDPRHLQPDERVPLSDKFRKIAQDVTDPQDSDLVNARALYDHTIDRMRYAKFDDQYGKGDAVYACDMQRGNCTDFHSYFMALARSVGIPARFAIGAGIPSQRNEGGMSGYHCWIEFYADGKWWPVDISEADKYSALSTYYFGHHPANRFTLSHGRDLAVEPAPASGPINFLAYPLLEVDGRPRKVHSQFTFVRPGSSRQM
jgi:transglutaminase-like putative cysteine protease